MRSPLSALSRRRARAEVLDELTRLGPDAPLARAVENTLAGAPSPEERRMMQRVEGRRAELDVSGETIEMLDFGAGSPTAGLGAEEMEQGRVRERRLGEISSTSSKPPLWASLLFWLVRELRPDTALELGTCVGVSASYQAAAMELNGKGLLVTLEGAPELARVAGETFKKLGVTGLVEQRVGRFGDTLGAAVAERGPFGLVFIDGHHDEQATLDYFEQLAGAMAPGGAMVFDDIDWSPGMERAWQRIAGDSRVEVAADMGAMGICLLGSGEPTRLDLPLTRAVA